MQEEGTEVWSSVLAVLSESEGTVNFDYKCGKTTARELLSLSCFISCRGLPEHESFKRSCWGLRQDIWCYKTYLWKKELKYQLVRLVLKGMRSLSSFICPPPWLCLRTATFVQIYILPSATRKAQNRPQKQHLLPVKYPLQLQLSTGVSRGHLCPLPQPESAWGLQLSQLCNLWPYSVIPVFPGLWIKCVGQLQHLFTMWNVQNRQMLPQQETLRRGQRKESEWKRTQVAKNAVKRIWQ